MIESIKISVFSIVTFGVFVIITVAVALTKGFFSNLKEVLFKKTCKDCDRTICMGCGLNQRACPIYRKRKN